MVVLWFGILLVEEVVPDAEIKKSKEAGDDSEAVLNTTPPSLIVDMSNVKRLKDSVYCHYGKNSGQSNEMRTCGIQHEHIGMPEANRYAIRDLLMSIAYA